MENKVIFYFVIAKMYLLDDSRKEASFLKVKPYAEQKYADLITMLITKRNKSSNTK